MSLLGEVEETNSQKEVRNTPPAVRNGWAMSGSKHRGVAPWRQATLSRVSAPTRNTSAKRSVRRCLWPRARTIHRWRALQASFENRVAGDQSQPALAADRFQAGHVSVRSVMLVKTHAVGGHLAAAASPTPTLGLPPGARVRRSGCPRWPARMTLPASPGGPLRADPSPARRPVTRRGFLPAQCAGPWEFRAWRPARCRPRPRV